MSAYCSVAWLMCLFSFFVNTTTTKTVNCDERFELFELFIKVVNIFLVKNILSEKVVIFFFLFKNKELFIFGKRNISEENTENSIFCHFFSGLIKYKIFYSKIYKFYKIHLRRTCKKQGNLANSNFGFEPQSGSIFSDLPSESQKWHRGFASV